LLGTEKAELEGKFAKERSEIEGNLVQECEAKANVVKALETQLSEQRTTAEKALGRLEAQLATLKLEHMNEIAALRSAIELLGTEKAELEGKFAKERSEIEGNLVQEREAKANVVKALETQLSEQRTTAEKALGKLEAQLATLKLEHIQELAELRVESKKEVVTLSNKFEEAVSSAKNWADVKMECSKEVESLNQKLAYLEAELAQAKSEAKASSEYAETLNVKLVEATNQVVFVGDWQGGWVVWMCCRHHNDNNAESGIDKCNARCKFRKNARRILLFT
jgi:chromosome segregation ATPase